MRFKFALLYRLVVFVECTIFVDQAVVDQANETVIFEHGVRRQCFLERLNTCKNEFLKFKELIFLFLRKNLLWLNYVL